MMTKQAHAEALQKIAAVDERDANAAFELGFAKAAADLGLDDAQYEAFHKAAVEKQNASKKA